MGQISRRTILAGAAAAVALGRPAIAQAAPLKVGMMLPFSGTYAALGENIASAFELLIAENGGKLAGRPVTLIRLDDESDPAKAPANVNRLTERDNVDVLLGTVHSGVVMALVQAAREKQIPLFIPNAGNVAATRELCSPSVFRSSFSNWQPAYGMGRALATRGVKKAAWVTWDYAAGKESGEGFRDGLRAGGAEMTHQLTVPFPETNFQPILAQISGLGVEAVGSFFAGGGAIQFVKDYAAAGLRDKVQLCGSGFLTEGVLKPQGAAAEGILTALHYGDGLDNAKNLAFRAVFKAKTGRDADVYAVQGYDAGQMLLAGLVAAKGDAAAVQALAAGIRAAKIDSPRGAFTLSASHNPVQTIWLRQAKDGQNKVIGAAVEALADPGAGCKMAGA
ncbi:MAG TPA: ABC transporter permease [Acetobacteraceae bacterium]|jgi:branched-chain amino acid transport system substrate-binding protein|nr:ABC transporter permease [Acetobacteraceae bacterium]